MSNIPRHVLLIEPHPDVRETIVRMLKSQGHAVTSLPEWEDAPLFLQSVRVDVLLCGDPGADVEKCMASLGKARAIQPSLRIIMAHACQPSDELSRCRHIDRFLHKPFTIAALNAIIQKEHE